MPLSWLRRARPAVLAVAIVMTPLSAATAAPAAATLRVDLGMKALDHRAILVSDHIGGQVEYDIASKSATAVRPRLTVRLPRHWSAKIAFAEHKDSCRTSGHDFVCTLKPIDKRATRGVEIRLFNHVHRPYGTKVPITARVSSPDAQDPNLRNNVVTKNAVIKGTADVVTHITRTPAKISKGHLAHFTISMTNQGPSPASGLTFALRVITGTHDGFLQHKPKGPAHCEAGSAGPVDALMPYACDAPTLRPGHTFVYRLSWRGLVRGAQGHMTIDVIHDGYQPCAQHAPGALRIQYVVTKSKRVTVRG
jgi:hypothetical protein